MTITDLKTEYGAYINHGQNANDILKKAQFGGETGEICTIVTTDDTVIRKGSASMSRVLQPFQKAFTPTGGITVSPSPIQLYKLKVDVQEYPDELEDSWLGFLASNDTDRKAWPFTRWLVEMFILAQAAEDLELNEVFAGEYAAPTPGTAGAAGTAMEGLRKILNDLIDGATITPTNTGAIEAVNTDFVTQVEDWFETAVDNQYKRLPLTIEMSLANAIKFRRGNRAKYNMSYDQVSELEAFADRPNVRIVGLPSWGTSDKILCTPRENLIMGVKRWSGNQLENMVESEDRKVKIFADFWRGVGFIMPELIWTNELDNPA